MKSLDDGIGTLWGAQIPDMYAAADDLLAHLHMIYDADGHLTLRERSHTRASLCQGPTEPVKEVSATANLRTISYTFVDQLVPKHVASDA